MQWVLVLFDGPNQIQRKEILLFSGIKNPAAFKKAPEVE